MLKMDLFFGLSTKKLKAATHINYLAPNQNILGKAKALRIGSGPDVGTGRRGTFGSTS
jgi:hypothetical protein